MADVYSIILEDGTSSDWWDGTESWGGEVDQTARDAKYSTRVYTSLSAWEAARDTASSTGDTEHAIIIGPWVTKDTSYFIVANFNASINIYCPILLNDGQSNPARHNGIFDDVEDAYMLQGPDDEAAIALLNATGSDFSIDGIQIQSERTAANLTQCIYGTNDGYNYFKNLCLHLITSDAGYLTDIRGAGSDGNYLENIVGTTSGSGTGARGILTRQVATTLCNCTVSGAQMEYGMWDYDDLNTYVNCAVFNINTGDFQGTPVSITYTASDDTESGTGNIDWDNGATDWAANFNDYSNGDFTPLNADLPYAGIGPGQDPNVPLTDINGKRRGWEWCTIGALEYQGTPAISVVTGEPVVDLSLPSSIKNMGFAADGAWHVDHDNEVAKVSFNRTYLRPNIVLHDFPFRTGTVASPTDLLLAHYKCNDNAASTTIVDTVGTANGTLAGGDNTEDKANTDAIRGRSLLLNGTDDYLNLTALISSMDVDVWSAIVRFKPNFSYDIGSNKPVITMALNASNYLSVIYTEASDRFAISKNLSGAGSVLGNITPVYTNNYDLQRWHTLIFSVNLDKDVVTAWIDGNRVTGMGNYSESNSWGGTPTGLWVGAWGSPHTYGAYYFDEIKILDEAIFPCGAYFTGNGQGLLADIDNPHAALTFFYDCQTDGSGAAKGGTNLATDVTINTDVGAQFIAGASILGSYGFDSNGFGNQFDFTNTGDNYIDPTDFSIVMWFNVQTWNDYGCVFDYKYGTDADNYISLVVISGDGLRFRYRVNGTSYDVENLALNMAANEWHCVRMDGVEGEYMALWLDGRLVGSNTSVSGTWAGTSAGIVRTADNGSDTLDLYVGALYIGKAGMPEIWTAFGKPLHLPFVVKT